MKIGIFRGLELSEGVARQLAGYDAIAKNAGCKKGVLLPGDTLRLEFPKVGPGLSWFEMFFQEFGASGVKDLIEIDAQGIRINFEKLKIDLHWVRHQILAKDLAFADSEQGLILYEEKYTPNAGYWYEMILWPLRGITVEQLFLATDEVVVRITPQAENVDETYYLKVFMAT